MQCLIVVPRNDEHYVERHCWQCIHSRYTARLVLHVWRMVIQNSIWHMILKSCVWWLILKDYVWWASNTMFSNHASYSMFQNQASGATFKIFYQTQFSMTKRQTTFCLERCSIICDYLMLQVFVTRVTFEHIGLTIWRMINIGRTVMVLVSILQCHLTTSTKWLFATGAVLHFRLKSLLIDLF